jgi:hypothetical protein
MASKQPDSIVKLEDYISLTVKAYQNGQFKSIQAAAAYDVPQSTLTHQISGRKARVDILANY